MPDYPHNEPLVSPTASNRNARLLVRYPSLSQVQKRVFDEMLVHLLARETEFQIQAKCKADDVFAAATAIRYDHPELFWYTGSVTVTENIVGMAETRTVKVETE